MRNRFSLLGFAFVVVAGGAGCKEQQAAPPTPALPEAAPSEAAPSAASAAPTASAAPAAGASKLASDGKLLHCPTAVAGTNTTIKDAPGGVELTITARDEKDDATASEIRARAAFLASASAAKGTDAGAHNGSGDVGGLFGRCPVVMRNTNLVVAAAPGGAKVTVTSRDPKEQEWLRQESRSRVDELAAPAAGENAHLKEVHCPTTVSGASVTVTDTPDGVSVKITAKDAAAAKEIRDRAHALAAAVQLGTLGRAAAGGGHHDGGGGGDGTGSGSGRGDGTGTGGGTHDSHGAGGGFGHCAVVVKDTALDAKDAPDGVTITLHAKGTDAVTAVRKQVHDRAAAP